MYRLSREVRFAINADETGRAESTMPRNGHGGAPPISGLAHFYALQFTVSGRIEQNTQYLVNIKRIDEMAREMVIPAIALWVARLGRPGTAKFIAELFEIAAKCVWPAGALLESLNWRTSPYQTIVCIASELPMTRFSQKFEFSATHRLHNPKLSDVENRGLFGKCNNAHGHGHNYELEVTLRGQCDASGVLIPISELERIVASSILTRFDHKNLNVELPEFAEVIPSVENIARVIYSILQTEISQTVRPGVELAAVTVWETPKTWCEYSEPA